LLSKEKKNYTKQLADNKQPQPVPDLSPKGPFEGSEKMDSVNKTQTIEEVSCETPKSLGETNSNADLGEPPSAEDSWLLNSIETHVKIRDDRIISETEAAQVTRPALNAPIDAIDNWFLGLPDLYKRKILRNFEGLILEKSRSFVSSEGDNGDVASECGSVYKHEPKALLPVLTEEKDEDEECLPAGVIAAGSTYPLLACADHTWEPCAGEHFSIRQQGYMSSKQKAPSGPSFFEVIKVDTFRTAAQRESVVIPRKIQRAKHSVCSNHPHVPSVIAINCQLPNDSPIMFNSTTGYNGPCVQMVFQFGITEQCRDWLAVMEAAAAQRLPCPPDVPNALKLLVEWCKYAVDDFDIRGRFKAMALVDNIGELDLPSMVASYNGKPTLITHSGTLTRGDDLLQLDINIHRFAFVARKGLDYVKEKLELGDIRIGFTIEAREDEYLPEQMLGCAFVKKFKRSRTELFENL